MARVGRGIAAAAAGWLTDGLLVLATERLLVRHFGSDVPPYYVIDFVTQCLYTVIGGYVCGVIAAPKQWWAIVGMIGLALLVGTVSVATSWGREPHWYAILLLVVYAPCALLGWTLRRRSARTLASER
jgi:hypothetical protein